MDARSVSKNVNDSCERAAAAWNAGDFKNMISNLTGPADQKPPEYHNPLLSLAEAHYKAKEFDLAWQKVLQVAREQVESLQVLKTFVDIAKARDDLEMVHFELWRQRASWPEYTQEQLRSLPPSVVTRDKPSDGKTGKSDHPPRLTCFSSDLTPFPEMQPCDGVDRAAWFIFDSAPNQDFIWWFPFLKVLTDAQGKAADCLLCLRFVVDAFMLPYLSGNKGDAQLSPGRFFAFAMAADRVGLVPALTDKYDGLRYLAHHLVVSGRKEAEMKAFWLATPLGSPHLFTVMHQLRKLVESVPLLPMEVSVFGIEDAEPSCAQTSYVDTSLARKLASPQICLAMLRVFDKHYPKRTNTADFFRVTAMIFTSIVFPGRNSLTEFCALIPYIKFRTAEHAWMWYGIAQGGWYDLRTTDINWWLCVMDRVELMGDPDISLFLYEMLIIHGEAIRSGCATPELCEVMTYAMRQVVISNLEKSRVRECDEFLLKSGFATVVSDERMQSYAAFVKTIQRNTGPKR